VEQPYFTISKYGLNPFCALGSRVGVWGNIPIWGFHFLSLFPKGLKGGYEFPLSSYIIFLFQKESVSKNPIIFFWNFWRVLLFLILSVCGWAPFFGGDPNFPLVWRFMGKFFPFLGPLGFTGGGL